MTLDDDHAMLETIRLARVGLTYKPRGHGGHPKGCNPRSWGAGSKARPVYANDGRWWLGLKRAGTALGVTHGAIVQAIKRETPIGYGVLVSRQPFDGVRYRRSTRA